MKTLLIIFAIVFCAITETRAEINMMQLPDYARAWYRNPDGSCVQCSIGMCGTWSNVPAAYSLLWNTEHGPAVRGGSWPERVSRYAQSRQIALYNVTGSSTYDWMQWSCKTGRFAAIAAGTAHFQTLYGWDDKGTPDRNDDTIYVCNNNSTNRIDAYNWQQFRRLHESSGRWVVILDTPGIPPVPHY
jgi:hypothetical protein